MATSTAGSDATLSGTTIAFNYANAAPTVNLSWNLSPGATSVPASPYNGAPASTPKSIVVTAQDGTTKKTYTVTTTEKP